MHSTPFLERSSEWEEEWTAAAETVPWGSYTRNAGPGHEFENPLFPEEGPYQVSDLFIVLHGVIGLKISVVQRSRMVVAVKCSQL